MLREKEYTIESNYIYQSEYTCIILESNYIHQSECFNEAKREMSDITRYRSQFAGHICRTF
jgi:hypothetical protein